MTEVLKKAPDQSALWKDKKNRLPEPWWQFLYLLFHRDAGLGDSDDSIALSMQPTKTCITMKKEV